MDITDSGGDMSYTDPKLKGCVMEHRNTSHTWVIWSTTAAGALLVWSGWAAQEVYLFAWYFLGAAVCAGAGVGFLVGRIYLGLDKRYRELDAAFTAVRELSVHDDLTGLYNRRFLISELGNEIARAIRERRSLSVLMIDVDDFKDVNDRHGHLAGDIVLRDCARIIRSTLRRIDRVGRYGGDEFLAVLPGLSESAARHVAERIRVSVEYHLFKAYGHTVRLTLSIGLYTPEHITRVSVHDFVERADQALLDAKRAGRNRIWAYAEPAQASSGPSGMSLPQG